MPSAVLEKPETKVTSGQKEFYRAPIALYENDDSYIVFVHLLGADEKSVQVRMEKGVLSIEAPLKLDLPPGSTPRYSEFRLGDYRRTLDLNDQIDEEKVEASFRGGLLRLNMPKSKAVKPRKIQIKTT